jgi:hypothetical protein
VKGTVLLNEDIIFGDLVAEQYIVALRLNSGDDVFNILNLLNFLIEFFLRLLDI